MMIISTEKSLARFNDEIVNITIDELSWSMPTDIIKVAIKSYLDEKLDWNSAVTLPLISSDNKQSS